MKQLRVIQRFKDAKDFSMHEVGSTLLVGEERADNLVSRGLCIFVDGEENPAEKVKEATPIMMDMPTDNVPQPERKGRKKSKR